jgi:CRISPR system Cascade subunit CasB
MNPHFDPKSPLGQALLRWHTELQENRGARAELRRCASPAAVVMSAEFHRVCRKWQHWLPENRHSLDRFAAVIGLAAQLDNAQDTGTFSKQMARPKNNGPVISELRFRRLLQQETIDDLYPNLIRIINQLDRAANLRNLAESVFYWSDGVRKDWAFDYYRNLSN